MIDRNKKIFDFVVVAVVFLSLISQLPVFVSSGITRLVSMPAWVVLFLIALWKNRGRIELKRIAAPLFTALFIILYWLVMGLFNPQFEKSDIPNSIVRACFILIVGNQLGSHIDATLFRKMLIWYVLAAVILGLVVYYQYFMGRSTTGRVYLYEEKNSTAMILLVAIVFLVFTPRDNGKFTIFRIILVVILSILILLMKSRAVYISYGTLLLVIVLDKEVNVKLKILFICLIIGAIVYLMLNENLLIQFIDDFVYAGRNGKDLNDLTSGRLLEWKYFFNSLGDGWLLGNGHMKRETLILTAWLEYGIIVGSIIIILAVYPLIKSIRSLKYGSDTALMFFVLSVGYTINMFFEELAPFGPGVKCCMLWLIVGIFASNPSLLIRSGKENYEETN